MLHSLRSRLTLLVILGILPGVLLVLVIASEQRARAVQEVQRTNISFLRLVTSNQTQRIQSARGLMVALAQIPSIHTVTRANAENCNALLAQILQNVVDYRGFSVSDLQGNTLCSAPRPTRPMNLSELEFFQRTLRQNDFVVGGYQIGVQTGKGNLTFGLPITDSTGKATAVLGAGIDINGLNDAIDKMELPNDYVVNIIDRSGALLVRWPITPNLIGTQPLDSPLIQHMLNNHTDDGSHTEELLGLDGVPRLYTFSTIGDPAAPDLMVTVGVSTEAAFSQINQTLWRNLVALAVAALLGILTAWLVSDALIMKPIARLSTTAQKLRAGDLTARTGIVQARDEIEQLARNVDDMAQRLQTQTLQLTTAERQQRILAEVGVIFSSPLDFTQRIDAFVKLLIEHVADWSMVNVFESDQTIKQLALAHKDSSKVPLAHELITNYPPNDNPGAVRDWLLQEQKSAFFPQITQQEVLKTARDARHAFLIEQVGVAGFMIVPLITQGRVLGEVTLVRGWTTPAFNEDDLSLMEEVARRAAIALDHALLFQTTQTLNQTLEQQVAHRTTQLRESIQRLRLSREQLRELAVRQREMLEEEQTRISREVHDNLGQSLTGLKMDIARLLRMVGPEVAGRPQVAKHIGNMTGLIDNTIQAARSIARQMRPSILDDLGLAAAIEWHCNDMQTRTGIQVAFENQAQGGAIPSQVATEAYRILQEALTNVIRHAQASQVRVTLQTTPEMLRLSIHDNGIGIEADQLAHTKSLGVLGMRERALMLGGSLDIGSEAGNGTTVAVELPLNPTAAVRPPQDF